LPKIVDDDKIVNVDDEGEGDVVVGEEDDDVVVEEDGDGEGGWRR